MLPMSSKGRREGHREQLSGIPLPPHLPSSTPSKQAQRSSEPAPPPRRSRGLVCLHLALLALVLTWQGITVLGDIIETTLVVGVINLDLTGAGPRPSVVFNGQWPGPTIYAKDGDTLKIKVINNQSLPITVHWHGIRQLGSQWYDGVPMVTQCALTMGNSYTHIFTIQGQWGTFWYHSHVPQLRNTLNGAIIVSPPTSIAENLPVSIEKDLLMLGGDWFTQSPLELMDSIGQLPFSGYPLPQSLHINGKNFNSPQYYKVVKGKWYRLRVINTAMYASFNLQIEKHMLAPFEAEASYISHSAVKWIDVYPGQSYSLLFKADQPSDNYWIVLSPRYDVATPAGPSTQMAVLSYERAKKATPNRAVPAGPTTAAEKTAAGPTFQAELKSRGVNQDLSNWPVTRLLMLELNQYTDPFTNEITYSMNNVTFTPPTIPFLLAYYKGKTNLYSTTLQPDLPPDGLDASSFAPSKNSPAVIQIAYGAVVQLVFQSHVPPGGLHSWHLHGYSFYVVAQGSGTFDAANWQKYSYNLLNPPYLNTIAMFDSTWVAVRFKADNPGQWILHCHLEQHADLGSAAILNVLYPKVNSRKKSSTYPEPLTKPPKDYPSC